MTEGEGGYERTVFSYFLVLQIRRDLLLLDAILEVKNRIRTNSLVVIGIDVSVSVSSLLFHLDLQ